MVRRPCYLKIKAFIPYYFLFFWLNQRRRNRETTKRDHHKLEPFSIIDEQPFCSKSPPQPQSLSRHSKPISLNQPKVSSISKTQLAPSSRQFVSRLDPAESLNKIKAKLKISQTKKLSDANGKECHKLKLKHSRSWDAKNKLLMTKSSSTNSHTKETRSSGLNVVSNGYVAAQATSASSNEHFPSQDSVDEYSYSTPSNNYGRQTNRYANTSTPSSTPFSSKIYHLDTDELFIPSCSDNK